MNIYCELKKNWIRLKIDSEEIEIKLRPDFYSKIKGTESYQMFLDTAINEKIKSFISRHRKKLDLYKIFKYIFLRNRALVMVDMAVQELMTIRLVHAYATLSLDARVVYVISKPAGFTDDKLETMENIKDAYLNNGKLDEDATISSLI